jgi:hypothetical protein
MVNFFTGSHHAAGILPHELISRAGLYLFYENVSVLVALRAFE